MRRSLEPMFLVKPFLIFALLFIPMSYAETLKIAAIDWCPQICINTAKPGYTVDLIKKVYQSSSYEVEIHVFPWSRAIKYVSDGKYDALLAPAKKEAPNLIYPRFSIGSQEMCFHTLVSSQWIYSGEESLSNLQVGIAFDTSIEKLNQYIEKHPERFQFLPYHKRYVTQSAQKLLKGRIDTFLSSKNSALYELNKADLNDIIKNVGCVSQEDIFIAFTTDKEKAEKITHAIQFFELRIEQLMQSGYINKLHQEYGIK